MIDFLIHKYFNFLTEKLQFKGPYSYNHVREYHTDFVKGNIIVKIACEGDFWVDIIQLKCFDPEIESGKKRVVDLKSNDCKYYEPGQLDKKKKLWNSVSDVNFPDKELWYSHKLIMKNPELLEGNFEKFSLKYRILKFLGVK